MKKQLSLLLAIVMLLSLTACGSAEETPAPTNTAAPEETTAAPTEKPVSASEVIGSVNGQSYTNPYFGMGCQLEDTWSIATTEEMAEIIGLTQDALRESEYSDVLEDSGLVYDLYASASDGLTTVNVTIENLGLLYGLTMDEAAYAEASVKQFPAALEAVGMTDVTTEITSISFAGSEHTAVRVHCLYSDVDFYETLVCVKKGNYMAVITAASYFDDITGNVLDSFHSV